MRLVWLAVTVLSSVAAQNFITDSIEHADLPSSPHPSQDSGANPYSWELLLGMALGTALPLLLLQCFQNVADVPMSTVPLLTESNQFSVGADIPAVVLVHSGFSLDDQDLCWTLEGIFTHFSKERPGEILFFTLDQTLEPELAAKYQQHTKRLPALLWVPIHATGATEIPIFFSNALSNSKESWIVSWIEQRYCHGETKMSELYAVEQLFSRIYHYTDGYDCSEAEQLGIDDEVDAKSWVGRLLSGHDASVYGEILPGGVRSWLDTLTSEGLVTEQDVIYDLGCGTGKVVFQATLLTACKKAIGIELSQSRHQHGLRAFKEAQALSGLGTIQDAGTEMAVDCARRLMSASGRIELVQGNVSLPIYQDATHVVAASTTWPDNLMHDVVQNLASSDCEVKTFATLHAISEEDLERYSSVITHWKTIHVAVSWQEKANCYIYKFKK